MIPVMLKYMICETLGACIIPEILGVYVLEMLGILCSQDVGGSMFLICLGGLCDSRGIDVCIILNVGVVGALLFLRFGGWMIPEKLELYDL